MSIEMKKILTHHQDDGDSVVVRELFGTYCVTGAGEYDFPWFESLPDLYEFCHAVLALRGKALSPPRGEL